MATIKSFRRATSISFNVSLMQTLPDKLRALRDEAGLTQAEVAEALGVAPTTYASKEDKKKFKRRHLPVDFATSLAQVYAAHGIPSEKVMTLTGIPALSASDTISAEVIADPDYVVVEILPTYAGMGGGGSGEDEVETTLVARTLIEDILRGRARDFLLVNVRGDSMEPDFRHGDQLLVDRRDTSPAQPGPFALWDGDDNEYVVKNVERAADGCVRIFSTNPKYSPKVVHSELSRIIGRPVWFARRL